jgi:outer membrane protein
MVLLSVVMLSGFAGAQEPSKIAVVDLQNALQTVNVGKKAKSQLEKELTAKKKTLQDEQSAIQKLVEEFKKQAAVLGDEARAKKQQELQERGMKLQESGAKSQMEMQQREAELTQPIIKNLMEVTREIANKKGYTVVLQKVENLVIAFPAKDDLSKEVIEAFNAKYK